MKGGGGSELQRAARVEHYFGVCVRALKPVLSRALPALQCMAFQHPQPLLQQSPPHLHAAVDQAQLIVGVCQYPLHCGVLLCRGQGLAAAAAAGAAAILPCQGRSASLLQRLEQHPVQHALKQGLALAGALGGVGARGVVHVVRPAAKSWGGNISSSSGSGGGGGGGVAPWGEEEDEEDEDLDDLGDGTSIHHHATMARAEGSIAALEAELADLMSAEAITREALQAAAEMRRGGGGHHL